jgi:hypothetical protein
MAELKKQPVGTIRSLVLRGMDLYYKLRFSNKSAAYWDNRYSLGGNSGLGSYGKVAEFKADVVNRLIDQYKIKSATELGCGDGNQLGMFEFPHYIGLDVSATAVAMCRQKYSGDTSKTFFQINTQNGHEHLRPYRSEMALSLDVIYHLIEDHVFHQYMRNLFSLSERFVVIYSSDTELNNTVIPQYKNRAVTDWIRQNIQGWEQIEHIPNPLPHVSASDFFVFRSVAS